MKSTIHFPGHLLLLSDENDSQELNYIKLPNDNFPEVEVEEQTPINEPTLRENGVFVPNISFYHSYERMKSVLVPVKLKVDSTAENNEKWGNIKAIIDG